MVFAIYEAVTKVFENTLKRGLDANSFKNEYAP